MSERTSLHSIYLNEIKIQLSSPLLPVITGLFLFISGFFFFNSTIFESLLATRIAQFQSSDWIGNNVFAVQPALSDMILLIIMMAPLISIRLSYEVEADAEDKPLLSNFKILLGKYLAALSIITGMIAATFLQPAVTALITSPDWGHIICSYGGLVLLAGAILAMRAFASSLTRYRVTATALTFGLIIVLWSIGWYSAIFPGDYRGAVLEELSLANQLSPFLKGVMSLKGIAYFFEVIFFFLVLTLSLAHIRRKRTGDTASKFSDSLRSILFAVLFGAICVAVHLITVNHDVSWSLNSSQRYGLSPQTKRIVHSVGFNVHIRAFETQGQERMGVRDLLGLYSRESKAITYEIIDPDARPGMARSLGISKYGQVALSGGGKNVLRDAATEEEITNALLVLKQNGKKNVYFLSGHGELETSDTGRHGLFQLAEVLKLKGYQIKELLLLRQNNVPQDADLLIVPLPKIDLASKELTSLQEYIDRGGKVMIALEPGIDGGLKGLLEGIGIGIGNGTIVDPSSKMIGGDDTMLIIDSYGGIRELSGFNCATLFPTSRILKKREKLPPYITVSSLARTSNESHAEDEPDTSASRTKAIIDSSYAEGPFDVALFARVAISEGIKPGIMVFGDADFLTNTYLNVSGNKAFALNCISALVNEGRLVRIDPERVYDEPFLLTPGKAMTLFLILVIFIPSLVLSLMVAIRRKRRQG